MPRTIGAARIAAPRCPSRAARARCSLGCAAVICAAGENVDESPPGGRADDEAVAQLAAAAPASRSPQELLEELGFHQRSFFEESVLEELPVEKVEPFALLSVWRAADDDAVAAF